MNEVIISGLGILLALYLNVCQKRERAAAENAEA